MQHFLSQLDFTHSIEIEDLPLKPLVSVLFQMNLSHPASFGYILIVYFHVYLGLPSDIFPLGSVTKLFVHIFSFLNVVNASTII